MTEIILQNVLDERQRSLLAAEIWGPASNREAEKKRLERLTSFWGSYEKEAGFDALHCSEILATIRTLRCSPDTPRSDLHREDDASPTTDEIEPAILFDLAVRSIFRTASKRSTQPDIEAVSGQPIFWPSWKESESLAKFLSRVFPISQPPQQDLSSFKADKLKASFLQAYASIRIEWTDYLSDHLTLLRGETWKKLYVFRHPGFITVSLERLATSEKEATQTLAEALKLGCLPPALLKETLLTMNLLFPVIGDRASRAILEREVRNHDLDPNLLDHFYMDARDHESPRDAIEPRNIKSLYEKYPYWADRLYDVWREADDPTPITRIERWTEPRRNPRFAYRCAVISIMLAFTFGLLGTGLAAAQLWITWCDWVDDPTVAQCGFKRSGGDSSSID